METEPGSYSPWRALTAMPDIHVDFTPLDDELGYWDPDTRRIILDSGQSRRELRCTLAHELEHIRRGDERIDHPFLALRQEIAVCSTAARRLVTLDALIAALLWSSDEHEIAEELNVDEDTLRIRVMTLTPDEHAEIDRRIRAARDDVYPAEESA